MSYSTKKLGKTGEDLAAEYLVKMGYRILERNYRFKRGEIDIIARDGDVLVFVEVKSRRNTEYGGPEYSITPSKVKQIRKIAGCYLYEKNVCNTDCRFDVIAILKNNEGGFEINYIKNAF